jgi:hypothetical protein
MVGRVNPDRPQRGAQLSMMASASATVLFGLGRLDDGSVGPDRFSKDQGEREASATEENSPVEQLNALPDRWTLRRPLFWITI